jgi:hypothetical protein
VGGVAKIDFISVEVDPLGAEASGKVTADAGRNDFCEAEKKESANTDGGA